MRSILVVVGKVIDFLLRLFVNRILDRVDPALETYGEPLIWRGCETEMKFSSALNLPSCSHEVSQFVVYYRQVYRAFKTIFFLIFSMHFVTD